jgi:hypothetical protein
MPLPQTNINAFSGMNAPTRSDPDNFDNRAEDAWNRLKSSESQFNTLATQTNAMATAANTSATNAAASATAAGTAKTNAETARTGAETARGQAQGYATSAYENAVIALNASASLTATSSTGQTIGAGSKTFLTQAGKAFAGQRLRIMNPLNNAQWMYGNVTSYSGTSLVVAIDDVNPATAGAVVANWLIGLGGEKGASGPPGGLIGGNATGAVNLRRANGVPIVSGVADIWSGAGNFMVLNGPGTVIDFPDAPQPGAERTVYVSGATTIQSGSRIFVYGGTQSLVTGDLLDIEALEVNVFLVTIRKRDGTPVAHDRGELHNLRQFGSSGVFTATKTGWHKITVTGSSGSGGAAAAPTGGVAAASGAGAGGFVSGMRYLTAGVNYAVAVFSGGAAVNAQGTAVAGNPGGNNSFSGPGITAMTANGGEGGKASITPGASVTGGAGGSASGASTDLTVTGGSGGSATVGNASSAAASGGGAVGVRGGSYYGGGAIGSGSYAAGGGAGVGGNGGAASNVAAAGGGSAGSASTTTPGINFIGAPGGAQSYQTPNELSNATGGGGSGNATGNTLPAAPNGGGSGGAIGNGFGLSAAPAGHFAGGGGKASTGGSGSGGLGGAYGGAPGGTALAPSSGGGQVDGVPGSSGAVWIEF